MVTSWMPPYISGVPHSPVVRARIKQKSFFIGVSFNFFFQYTIKPGNNKRGKDLTESPIFFIID